METMELIKIALVFVVGYFILKFIWGSIKGIAKLLIMVVVIAVGTYIVNHELLYNMLGKDNVEAAARKAENGANKIGETASDVADSLKEKGKEIVKDVTK